MTEQIEGSADAGDAWVYFTPRGDSELPAQGWKLPISARAASIRRIADLALLNEGVRNPASMGKAISESAP